MIEKKLRLDIQGHRGCRGLYPENTIPAFLHAIKLGVNTLEMDVVISRDHQVIVSHEPFMNHEICLLENGDPINFEDEKKHNVYDLSYEKIKKYNTGKKYNEKFPHQVKLNTYKPSLPDVVTAVEHIAPNILYNIEIKRKTEWDSTYHPDYKAFADLVIKQIQLLGIMSRTTVQCFDVQTLKYIKETYPKVRLVYLVENKLSTKENFDNLGFFPFIYSPYFKMVDIDMIKHCESINVQVIPWTINEIVDLEKYLKLGVNGIITDYPDRLIQLYRKLKK